MTTTTTIPRTEPLPTDWADCVALLAIIEGYCDVADAPELATIRARLMAIVATIGSPGARERVEAALAEGSDPFEAMVS